MLRKKTRKFLGNRCGSAMIELAIGSGVLMSVFTAAFQYGYIFYQYNVLYSAIENAARFASTYPYTDDCNTPLPSTFSTAVKAMAVYGNPAATSGTPLVPGLTTSNINVQISGLGTCGVTWAPTAVTVSIGGTDDSGAAISSLKINAVFGSFTATGKPKVAYPYSGQYQPY
jgi:Flp pilus assembly protein TadG